MLIVKFDLCTFLVWNSLSSAAAVDVHVSFIQMFNCKILNSTQPLSCLDKAIRCTSNLIFKIHTYAHTFSRWNGAELGNVENVFCTLIRLCMWMREMNCCNHDAREWNWLKISSDYFKIPQTTLRPPNWISITSIEARFHPPKNMFIADKIILLRGICRYTKQRRLSEQTSSSDVEREDELEWKFTCLIDDGWEEDIHTNKLDIK